MDTTPLRARPTTYRGIRMRSRLEAQWAADFDNAGWIWEYEPRCFADESGQYLPDFYVVLPNGRTFYLEVRGYPCDHAAARRRMEIIWSSEPNALLVYDRNDDAPWFAGGFLGRTWRQEQQIAVA